MTDELARRKELTFEQAEGAEELPSQLKLREISQELRAALWSVVYYHLEEDSWTHDLKEPWSYMLRQHWVTRLWLPVDEYDARYAIRLKHVKLLVMEGDYLQVFGFLQFIIRQRECPPSFIESVSRRLAECRAAYRLVERTFVPLTSRHEGKAILDAFAGLQASDMDGARSHLDAASQLLTQGQYPDSIRESANAVEATARRITGQDGLGKALSFLEQGRAIHPSLKKAFGAIYGYTSDQQGIRHPLVDEPIASVDEADALFMLGACSAFISYLLAKSETRSAS